MIRLFHWAMVACVAGAWWTHGRDLRLHILAGMTLAGLLLFRLIWGFIGPDNARLVALLPDRDLITQHLRDLLALRARTYPAHTPIGSLMIWVLLTLLAVLAGSGMALMALKLGIGPFVHWAANTPFRTELLVQTVHAWCHTLLLYLVPIHLSGVVVESLLQRQNLVMAMVTGRRSTPITTPEHDRTQLDRDTSQQTPEAT